MITLENFFQGCIKEIDRCIIRVIRTIKFKVRLISIAVLHQIVYHRYTLVWPRQIDGVTPSIGGTEIGAWCCENFGPPGKPRLFRTGRWLDAGDAAYFLFPDDAFAFKMRWG